MISRGIGFALIAATITGCATIAPAAVADYYADMQEQADEARAHREALVEFCSYDANACDGGMPRPGTLPVYSESCGYLPPLLGDDC